MQGHRACRRRPGETFGRHCYLSPKSMRRRTLLGEKGENPSKGTQEKRLPTPGTKNEARNWKGIQVGPEHKTDRMPCSEMNMYQNKCVKSCILTAVSSASPQRWAGARAAGWRAPLCVILSRLLEGELLEQSHPALLTSASSKPCAPKESKGVFIRSS